MSVLFCINYCFCKFFNFFHKRINQFIFRYASDDLAFSKYQATSYAACNSEISFSCFSRAVDGTSHDCDFNRFFESFDLFFHFFGHIDQIDLCTAASRAGNENRPVLLDSDRAQYFFGSSYFFQRIICQRYAYGVSNAVQKKRTDTDCGFDRAAIKCPCFCDA